MITIVNDLLPIFSSRRFCLDFAIPGTGLDKVPTILVSDQMAQNRPLQTTPFRRIYHVLSNS